MNIKKKEYKKPMILKIGNDIMVSTASCCSSGWCHGWV